MYLTVGPVGGRTGHHVKNIWTAYVLRELLGVELCSDADWDHSYTRYFSLSRNIAACTELTNARRVPYSKMSFDGLSPEQLSEFVQFLLDARHHTLPTIVELRSHTRVQMYEVNMWEHGGGAHGAPLLGPDHFDRLLSLMRSLFWNEPPCVAALLEDTPDPRAHRFGVVHARRGDVAEQMIESAFGNTHFLARVMRFTVAHTHVRDWMIVSENSHAADLKTLETDGVRVLLGRSFEDDFYAMIAADVFMPSSSSMSTWAAYLSRGVVLIHASIKQFAHAAWPTHFVRVECDGSFNVSAFEHAHALASRRRAVETRTSLCDTRHGDALRALSHPSEQRRSAAKE